MSLESRKQRRLEAAREKIYGRKVISKMHENEFRYGVLATGSLTLIMLLITLVTGSFYIPGLALAEIDRVDDPIAYWFIVLMLLVFVLIPIRIFTSSRYSTYE